MFRLSELVKTVSKKAIPDHQKNVILEICADDQSGQDVEVPYVMMKMGR
jgi:ubiquitin-activating enzyme E1